MIPKHLWFGYYFRLKKIGRDPKSKAFRYLKRLQAKATGEYFYDAAGDRQLAADHSGAVPSTAM